MSDVIYRQDAIDKLAISKEFLMRVLDDMDVVGQDREKFSWGVGLIESCINDIEELPPAEPRKKGKWIPDEIAAYDMPKGEPRGWVPWLCSECGWCVGKHQTAFCPSCGADMRGEEDE